MQPSIGSEFDHAAACELYGLTAAELEERFRDVDVLATRCAYVRDRAVGIAVASRRPDARVFVTHRLADDTVFAPLLASIAEGARTPIHVTVDSSRPDHLDAAKDLGFVEELVSVRYRVPTRPAIEQSARACRPIGCRVVQADEVHPDALFELDTVLRNDVPGNDGWLGNRAWFDAELASPEFDPAAYSVGIDEVSGALVGLCRIWRNDDVASLGMLGVRRTHRRGFVSLALLRAALDGASAWGVEDVETHTARPALQRRIERLGGVSTGGFVRLVRSTVSGG